MVGLIYLILICGSIAQAYNIPFSGLLKKYVAPSNSPKDSGARSGTTLTINAKEKRIAHSETIVHGNAIGSHTPDGKATTGTKEISTSIVKSNSQWWQFSKFGNLGTAVSSLWSPKSIDIAEKFAEGDIDQKDIMDKFRKLYNRLPADQQERIQKIIEKAKTDPRLVGEKGDTNLAHDTATSDNFTPEEAAPGLEVLWGLALPTQAQSTFLAEQLKILEDEVPHEEGTANEKATDQTMRHKRVKRFFDAMGWGYHHKFSMSAWMMEFASDCWNESLFNPKRWIPQSWRSKNRKSALGQKHGDSVDQGNDYQPLIHKDTGQSQLPMKDQERLKNSSWMCRFLAKWRIKKKHGFWNRIFATLLATVSLVPISVVMVVDFLIFFIMSCIGSGHCFVGIVYGIAACIPN